MSSVWAQRWLAALDGPDGPERVRRGRGEQYFRSGRVTGLRVRPGALTARVQGSHAAPYQVRVSMPVLSDDDWSALVERLAGQVGLTAQLLAGHVPEGLDDQLRAHDLALVPSAAQLRPSCGCPDRDRLCAHVVAVWEAGTAAVERDPFTLLALRGRGRQRLLADLSSARGVTATRPLSVPLGGLATTHWAAWPGPPPDLTVPAGRPPALPAAPLRLLGDPPGWEGVDSYEVFRPLIQAAARAAGELTRRSTTE